MTAPSQIKIREAAPYYFMHFHSILTLAFLADLRSTFQK